MGLFRKEVIENSQHITGPIVLSTPKFLYSLVWGAVLVIGFSTIMVLAMELDERIEVQGVLVNKIRPANINAPQSGLIEQWHVQSGEEVIKGQPLLTFRSDQSIALMQSWHAQIKTLSEQKSLLQSQYELQHTQITVQISNLSKQQAVTEQTLDVATEQLLNMTALAHKRQQIWREAQPYESLSISKQHVASLEQEYRQIDNQRVQIDNSVRQYQQDLQQYANQADALLSELAMAELSYQSKVFELEQKIADIQTQRTITLYAPRDGHIDDLVLVAHAAVRQGQQLVTILPTEQALDIELHLAPRQFAQVATAQLIAVSLDGFPIHHYGVFPATITQVSSSFVPSVSQMSAGVFVAQAQFEEMPNIPIKSGMPIRAQVKLKRRKLWQWLFEPLILQWYQQGGQHV